MNCEQLAQNLTALQAAQAILEARIEVDRVRLAVKQVDLDNAQKAVMDAQSRLQQDRDQFNTNNSMIESIQMMRAALMCDSVTTDSGSEIATMP